MAPLRGFGVSENGRCTRAQVTASPHGKWGGKGRAWSLRGLRDLTPIRPSGHLSLSERLTHILHATLTASADI